MKRILGLLAALTLGLAPALFAQPAASGNIYGTVTDASGAALPGAAIVLTSDAGSRSTTSGAQGDFRFLNVPHGTHKLVVSMTGFGTVNRDIVIAVGQNVQLTFNLKVAAMAEAVTVTAESPIVDSRKVGISTSITKDELSKIPTARDPWGILQTIPGVTVDRVNLAGNESGQQAGYQGKGADPKNNVWAIDGVVITDMATFGASPTYYTYDAFDQVSVSAGGNDITQATGAVGIGFATKRGTNAVHGNAVGYFTHDDLQWSNIPAELEGDARLQGSDKADHTQQISDYNFDLGLPILKDKLWIWGSWGREDIRILRLTQTSDKTVLDTKTAKLNWQASPKDMISAFWFLGSKIKIGRSPGSGLTESDSYLWDQGNYFPQQPHGLSKIEWNRTFSPNFFLNAKWAYYSTGFTLAGRGNDDQILNFVTNQASGNANSQNFLRPQTTWQLDGSYFLYGAGGSHELRFGGSWRKTGAISENFYAGNKTQARFNTTGSDRARFYRDAASDAESKYLSFYASDTFTRDRLTLTLGLRFDKQQGEVLPSSVPANPLIPDKLPAIDFAGGGQGIDWSDLSPRVGFTYALNESRRTLLRGSFGYYAGQLQTGAANFDSPVGGAALLEYDWKDLNGDQKISNNEVDFSVLRASSGVDPNNPGSPSTPDRIDPDLSSDNDYEVVLGLDHELVPNLAVGVAYTWRRNVDTFTRGLDNYWTPRIGVTAADYTQGAPVTRNGYTVTPYVLNAGVTTRPGVTGGRLLSQRPDFHRQYNGLEFTLVKRLSSKWMARASFSYMDWQDKLEGPLGHFPNPNPIDTDPGYDGGQVIRTGTGSGKLLYVNAKWQFSANGLYQLPWDMEVAANVFGRQGYPRPFYLQVNTGAFEGTTNILAISSIEDERLPDLFDMDLRLAKNLKLGGTRLTLSVECFNMFNSNTEINRVVNASSSVYNRLEEIMAPRIVRFGARFGF